MRRIYQNGRNDESVLGQKQTSNFGVGMSAFGGKADIWFANLYVRYQQERNFMERLKYGDQRTGS